MRTIALAALALGLATAARAEDKALTDPQIANIALTAHQIDIDRGKLALKHTKNAEVRQFAEQMVNDHEAGKKEAIALATKLGVKPEESAVSKSLKDGAAVAGKRLKKEKGAAYDKDYIDTEVGYHQAVIDAVKNTLVPGAQNAELKTLLQQAVPTLEGHLQHAKMVQSQVGTHAAKQAGMIGIAVNLVAAGFYDIAVRDVVMAISSFCLAPLTAVVPMEARIRRPAHAT